MARLLAAGGNPNTMTSRGSMLDYWLHYAGSSDPENVDDYLESLGLLLQAGLDCQASLEIGGSFLTQCWASASLRPHMGRLLDMGFDPHAKTVDMMSFEEFLIHKARVGPGKVKAKGVLADIDARSLSATTPSCAPSRAAIRL